MKDDSFKAVCSDQYLVAACAQLFKCEAALTIGHDGLMEARGTVADFNSGSGDYRSGWILQNSGDAAVGLATLGGNCGGLAFLGMNRRYCPA